MVTSNRDIEFELIMSNHTGRHRGSGSLGGGGRPVYNITSSQRVNRWALGCVAQTGDRCGLLRGNRNTLQGRRFESCHDHNINYQVNCNELSNPARRDGSQGFN